MSTSEFSPQQIRARLRPLDRAGAPRPTGEHSDFDLNGPAAVPERLRPAAVLVPLVEHADGLRVLLTRRTDHLYHHAGQVSFPGGRLEEDDSSLVDTALREAQEEIGLPRQRVDAAGLLDEYETVTRFLVTPVVGFLRPGFELVLDDFEVAEAFEVPLAFILDPANHQIHASQRDGQRRRYYVFEYEHHYIWGATAGMLMNFYRRLNGIQGPTRPAPDGRDLVADAYE